MFLVVRVCCAPCWFQVLERVLSLDCSTEEAVERLTLQVSLQTHPAPAIHGTPPCPHEVGQLDTLPPGNKARLHPSTAHRPTAKSDVAVDTPTKAHIVPAHAVPAAVLHLPTVTAFCAPLTQLPALARPLIPVPLMIQRRSVDQLGPSGNEGDRHRPQECHWHCPWPYMISHRPIPEQHQPSTCRPTRRTFAVLDRPHSSALCESDAVSQTPVFLPVNETYKSADALRVVESVDMTRGGMRAWRRVRRPPMPTDAGRRSGLPGLAARFSGESSDWRPPLPRGYA
jgi:hypothetical protein